MMGRMRSQSRQPALAAWIALIAVYFLWGSTYIGIRYAVESIPPFLMAGSRYLSAGLILLAVLFVVRRSLPPVTKKQVLSTAVAGGSLLLGGNGLLSFGEKHLQSGVAALLVATVPLIMIVESAAVGRRGIARRSLLAIVLGTAGVVILVGTPGSVIDYTSAAVVFVGAFFWATGSVYLTNADMPDNPILGTALEMTFGGAMVLIVGLASGELGSLHFGSITTTSTLGWLWLVGPGSLLGFTAYTYALKTLPTATVATYAYVNPVVAVILGAALGDQPLSLGLLVGGAAVISAVVVTLAARRTPIQESVAPKDALAEIA